MKSLAALLLLPLVCCQPRPNEITSPNHLIIQEFNSCRSEIPVWSKHIYPSVHEWAVSLDLGQGLTLRISADQTVGGRFLGQYSDEQPQRVIGNAGDYVYPCDLRIDKGRGIILAKASGLSGGIAKATILFEFDITSRQLLHAYQVASELFPPEPVPVTPPSDAKGPKAQ
jgi:hypothetical protein